MDRIEFNALVLTRAAKVYGSGIIMPDDSDYIKTGTMMELVAANPIAAIIADAFGPNYAVQFFHTSPSSAAIALEVERALNLPENSVRKSWIPKFVTTWKRIVNK